ncbi:MAG: GDP-mannose 4,6-dehydratase [Candidatus Rokubacteria bacterium]|nr:GDP-mannose 4,6-dehydratase [Candidatus Rokubacteria bacterium]
MRIFITGGAGFIGSHVAEFCADRGDQVYLLDDLSTGAVENIARIKDRPNVRYYIDTVADERLVAELVDVADIVFHFAAAVGVRLIVESPVRTIETNIRGTEIVLRHAAKKRKRVLITSTSEVYGKLDRVPFREDDDLVLGSTSRSRWSYACSKAIDEFLALAYWKENRVPTVIARLFNTVGPRQTGRYGMVIPNFVQQALAGRDITVFGDGSQRRCFLHVADTVRALVGLAEHPRAVGEVYNVGSDEEVTILRLAERVRELTGSQSRIVFVPYAEAYEAGFEDMMRRVPDTSKLGELLGFRRTRDLDDILLSVIEHERRAAGTSAGNGSIDGGSR